MGIAAASRRYRSPFHHTQHLATLAAVLVTHCQLAHRSRETWAKTRVKPSKNTLFQLADLMFHPEPNDAYKTHVMLEWDPMVLDGGDSSPRCVNCTTAAVRLVWKLAGIFPPPTSSVDAMLPENQGLVIDVDHHCKNMAW